MTDWRDLLAAARRPATPEQVVWDGHYHRWWRTAVRSGRTPNAAVPIAYTRTEAQYGQRPDTPEETQR